MTLFFFFLFVTLFAYSCLIFYYCKGWKLLENFTPPIETDYEITISVIVAARNEENRIANLLTSLVAQSYPSHLFEIIVINDHSTDFTEKIVKEFSTVKLISLNQPGINSYKKKAIEIGIASAIGNLIITIDADCIAPINWLKTIVAFKKKTNAVFIAAPVTIDANNSFLQTFQALDFMVLQGITAASVRLKFHNMCNGANLIYDKSVFNEVDGFSGIDHISSGDDMLLMQKISNKYPSQIHYLHSKDAIVTTSSVNKWKEFFQQRIRWASKATQYKDKNIFLVLVLVYLLNLTLFIAFVMGFWIQQYWLLFLLGCIVKGIVEYLFVYRVAIFFGRKNWMSLLFVYQPAHILYTLITGWLGAFGKFEWKGRSVK